MTTNRGPDRLFDDGLSPRRLLALGGSLFGGIVLVACGSDGTSDTVAGWRRWTRRTTTLGAVTRRGGRPPTTPSTEIQACGQLRLHGLGDRLGGARGTCTSKVRFSAPRRGPRPSSSATLVRCTASRERPPARTQAESVRSRRMTGIWRVSRQRSW